MQDREPDMKPMGGPNWWHHHGSKMHVAAKSLGNQLLIIQGSAAEVIILKVAFGWRVSWRVIQSQTEGSSGTVLMNDNTLSQAFGLSDRDPDPIGSEALLNKYGGSVAHQGQFIRFNDYLNIPCPGTGNDGDPNVSVELSDAIRAAIKELLYKAKMV